jgi:hypothetical protein
MALVDLRNLKKKREEKGYERQVGHFSEMRYRTSATFMDFSMIRA